MRRRLWDSPEGRKRTVGDSAVFRKQARKGFCQRAQISGEVMMKGRKGFPLAEFGEAWGEGAEDAGGDGDVVGGGGRFEGYDGHGISMVSHWLDQ